MKHIAFTSQSIRYFFLSQAERNAISFQNGVGEKFCCVTVARLEVSFVAESIPTEAFAVIIQRQTGILRSLDSCFLLQFHFKCLYAVGFDRYIQLIFVEICASYFFFRTVCKHCLLYFTGKGDGCLLGSCASGFIYAYYIFIRYFRFFQCFDDNPVIA